MTTLRHARAVGRLAVAAVVVAGLSASGFTPGSGGATTRAASAAAAPDADPAPSALYSETTPEDADPVGPDETVLGPAAVEAMGDDLDAVAALNDLSVDELTTVLQDPTYGVGPDGRLFVAEFLDADQARDPGHAHDSAEAPAAGTDPVALAAVVPLDQTFRLNSLPGSTRTIYLDFTGHMLTNTVWNQMQGIPNGRTVPPFSLDGSAAFSNTELEFIQNVWVAVSEDYAPFDVNVTTQDPGQAAITRSSSSDQVYGARAIITTPVVQADFPADCPITSSCAGLAYVDVFDLFQGPGHRYYEGAFINAASTSNPLALTTIISHEVGHNGGLNHAGFGGQAYYSGTGNWGPIMGTPYARALSQWTTHAYSGANNGDGPDLTILASNGIRARADDAGATVGTAAPSGWTTSRRGLVSAPGDQDMWNLGRCDGTVTVTATPSTFSTNLDLSLSLVVGTSVQPLVDPPSGQTGNGPSLRATGVGATVQRSGGDTQYYALVQGSTSGPDGGYGNLGPYQLAATCQGISQQPPGLLRFVDVGPTYGFFTEIEWLASRGITTGYDQGNGTAVFQPHTSVARDAMAAFLYRYTHAGANPPVSGAGVTSGFTDVSSTHLFKDHILWLASTGITTGYPNGDGDPSFRPQSPVARDAMAAFLYRLADPPVFTPPTRSPFTDVLTTHQFYREIAWLASTGITTGYPNGDGSSSFRPQSPVARDAMAAFLYRFSNLPAG
ncbi:MAG: S-layer homology domain-containing protein [Aeromicrobium sp.]|uniref:S-layer homology domain-containing protein n=1 Tax=Aeromicrobium sp. TaxID=1871063 RepID=UPI0026203735|nr:S-layer homology domain-containing protein [Aeromicrobium sp.]MDF1704973.1 S-layer homology domain-containing protein [Aeromicrobium sp.]